MGLDSLSNNIVQKAIASMALSDVAAVCRALSRASNAEKPDVVLIIDAIAEAINEQVIQILNKGRGAGFKAFVAFQARADRRGETWKRGENAAGFGEFEQPDNLTIGR